jgi:hypothetical protein
VYVVPGRCRRSPHCTVVVLDSSSANFTFAKAALVFARKNTGNSSLNFRTQNLRFCERNPPSCSNSKYEVRGDPERSSGYSLLAERSSVGSPSASLEFAPFLRHPPSGGNRNGVPVTPEGGSELEVRGTVTFASQKWLRSG